MKKSAFFASVVCALVLLMFGAIGVEPKMFTTTSTKTKTF
jgi:hypothetical protein